jgi:hypothetical protein
MDIQLLWLHFHHFLEGLYFSMLTEFLDEFQDEFDPVNTKI